MHTAVLIPAMLGAKTGRRPRVSRKVEPFSSQRSTNRRRINPWRRIGLKPRCLKALILHRQIKTHYAFQLDLEASVLIYDIVRQPA
jgi:hypothetical protein